MVRCWVSFTGARADLHRSTGSDSPDSAKKELGMIFEGWDQDWWMEQQIKVGSELSR